MKWCWTNEPDSARSCTSDSEKTPGTKFWAYPKKAPRPLEFDPTDEEHFAFIINLAKAWSIVCKVSCAPHLKLWLVDYSTW